jgi:hypothetical protein
MLRVFGLNFGPTKVPGAPPNFENLENGPFGPEAPTGRWLVGGSLTSVDCSELVDRTFDFVMELLYNISHNKLCEAPEVLSAVSPR